MLVFDKKETSDSWAGTNTQPFGKVKEMFSTQE